MAEFKPTHRHLKRGSTYEVIGEAEIQIAGTPPVEGDSLTIYRAEDGKLWARASKEFHDGRFLPLVERDGETMIDLGNGVFAAESVIAEGDRVYGAGGGNKLLAEIKEASDAAAALAPKESSNG